MASKVDKVLARMIRDAERGGVNGYPSAESVAFRAMQDDRAVVISSGRRTGKSHKAREQAKCRRS